MRANWASRQTICSVSQPDTGEQALEIAETLVRSGAIDIIVVDSVAALVPRAEIEGEMGDAHMGLQARLMSQALRKLTAAISKSQTTVIFINQIRMKLGVMFGNPETTTGGNALKFYSSVRLDIRRIESIKEGQDVTRQPGASEGREEQARAAVQTSRVRCDVCGRDFEDGRIGRSGGGEAHFRKSGRMVLIQVRSIGSGARGGERLPANEPSHRPGHREQTAGSGRVTGPDRGEANGQGGEAGRGKRREETGRPSRGKAGTWGESIHLTGDLRCARSSWKL